MNSNLNIIILEKGDIVDVWPGRKNAYRCIVFNSDNTKSEMSIPKAECELLMQLRIMKSKLTESQMLALKELITSFGDERYYQGISDESIQNAGADI